MFDGLTSLEELDLGLNSLTTLPAGVFDGLTSLTTLYLNYNQLATLPAGVFDELTALTGWSCTKLSGHASRRGVRRADLADGSVSVRKRADLAPYRVFDNLTALTDCICTATS